MHALLPGTETRLAAWREDPDVLGVLLVGSRSQGHADALSDDDLEVLYTEERFALLAPTDCLELHHEGEGEARRLIYDAQLTTLAELERKPASSLDLDHWPYERARVLFDRDGHVREAVEAAARMDPAFRAARLQHATLDAWITVGRGRKTLQRGFAGSGRLLAARGARAMARILFALEWRWVPMDHWLEADLRTLSDPTGAAPRLLEALAAGSLEPLVDALRALEDTLASEGVPRPAERVAFFLRAIHPSGAVERAIHALQ